MAYEYLNECTDRMFNEYKKPKISIASSPILNCMLIFYEDVLTQSKFKTQRWHFQRKLIEVEPAFAIGYFGKQKKVLSDEAKTLLQEYADKRNLKF